MSLALRNFTSYQLDICYLNTPAGKIDSHAESNRFILVILSAHLLSTLYPISTHDLIVLYFLRFSNWYYQLEKE